MDSSEICSPWLALEKRMSRFFARCKSGRSPFVRAIYGRRPGHRDAHGNDDHCPDKFIVKAERLIKERIGSDVGFANATASDVTMALKVLKRIGLDSNNPVRLKSHVDDMLSHCNRIQQRRDDLFQLDKALCRLDLKWLNRTHGFRLTRLTPAQCKAMQENVTEEYRRGRANEKMETIQLQIAIHQTAICDLIQSATKSLERGDIIGATAWLYKCLLEREKAPYLEAQIHHFEKRLLRLLAREQKELAQIPTRCIFRARAVGEDGEARALKTAEREH